MNVVKSDSKLSKRKKKNLRKKSESEESPISN